ncbi:MAG TPA: hypothetical protein EYP85_14985 [Armatimonadetes bacterium]|nr:hypothetical protein [Armatimonadota bacterium]
MEKVAFGGWPNCYRLSNGTIEVIATTDVGPRIIRFGFVGEENEFKEFAAQLGQTGGEEWRIYGGHRLWHAPEERPRTYYPDNSPLEARVEGNTLHLIQPPETTTGIQKEIDLTVSPRANQVTVVHRLRNQGMWTVELAAWALTVMAPGGFAIVPQEPYVSHAERLLPVRPLVLWGYTDMSDPRWTWGQKFVLLRQDPNLAAPQKAGFGNTQGWVAYARQGHLFLKRFHYFAGATYPDFGCTTELFTNDAMLEVETLSPLARLQPGGVITHTEHWFLFKEVPVKAEEGSVEALVLPKVEAAEEMVED